MAWIGATIFWLVFILTGGPAFLLALVTLWGASRRTGRSR